MNRKLTYFFIAFAVISVMELFQWELLPNPLQDSSNGYVVESSIASKQDLQANVVSASQNAETSSQQGDAAKSTSASSMLDPVTMLLLGSGLIGLAGLGRKKV